MRFLFTARLLVRRPIPDFFPDVAVLAFVAALMSLFSAATLAADGVPLTLERAQRLAVDRSRQLPAQDHAVMASREMAVAAGQLPDPVLRVGIDNLPVNGPERFSLTDDFMTMRRVGVMQEWTRADKRQLRANRFEREAEKSLAEKAMAIAAIERDTALAWLDRYYAEAMAAVIAEQGEQARLEIQATEGAYRSGRGNQADIFAARNALASFDDRASEIARRVSNARTMLGRWIGGAAEAPLAGIPDTEAIRMDPATLDTQLADLPQIAVMAKREEIAATEEKLAQANKKADWTVEVAYQQRGPAFSNMISIGVSIPLQWDQAHRQNREHASKLALLEQAKAEREEALRGYVAEGRIMINEWQNNRERLVRFQRELIPLANDGALATIAAYRGGKSSLADVLAARRNEIDVRIQALQLQTDTARLWAQINSLFPTTAHASQPTGIINRNAQ